MARRISEFPWRDTPLGPMAGWPATLHCALGIVLFSRVPSYLLWNDAATLLYNDAFAALIGDRHPAALGRPVAEAFPELLSEPGAVGGDPAAEAFHDRLRSFGEAGNASRQFSESTAPVLDQAGGTVGLLRTLIEKTADEWTRASHESETSRLRDLFQQSPGFMVVLRGPQHLIEAINPPYLDLIGNRDVLGRTVQDALPELEGQGLLKLLDHVFATGEPYVAKGQRVLLQRIQGDAPQERVVDFVYQPIRDRGQVTGIFVQGMDVTGAARSEERRREFERLAKVSIDALPQHMAVIDETGLILMTNRAWRHFARQNGGGLHGVSEGANYIAECRRALAAGDTDAGEVLAMIERAMQGGDPDPREFTYGCHSPTEERWFAASVNATTDGLAPRAVIAHRDVTERFKHQKHIEYLATHDPLTGLPNRVLLESHAERGIAACRASGLGAALLFIDLVDFKNTNDLYGHAVGDQLLKAVAAALREAIEPEGTVGRISGDEFVVLLTDVSEPAVAGSKAAQRILDRFSAPMQLDKKVVNVDASIGISVFPADGDRLDDLLRKADTAMYEAKATGRGRSCVYTPALGARIEDRLRLGNDLRHALPKGQLRLVYQPQVDLRTGRVVGAEALLRWRHPELGEISPQRFIPVAEETGLIIPIGRWILRVALQEAAEWQCRASEVCIAVNISAVQFRDSAFVGMVKAALAETGLDPTRLELEITESMMLEEDESHHRLAVLKAMGVSIAIDDFGTGFSNLSRLRSFPLDRLKIDRSFVAGLPDNHSAASIVSAVAALGQSLDLDLIAEGVETHEQAEFLRGIGCTIAQGFLLGRPLEAEDFRALVAQDARDAGRRFEEAGRTRR